MGVLNLWVAFNFSTDTWVSFKLFGGMGLMIAFIVLQGVVLARYLPEEKELPPADKRRADPAGEALMLYAIVGDDVPNSLEQRLAARPAHLARLTELDAAGRLALAAPAPRSTAPIRGRPASPAA
jgi:hypothetical protein